MMHGVGLLYTESNSGSIRIHSSLNKVILTVMPLIRYITITEMITHYIAANTIQLKLLTVFTQYQNIGKQRPGQSKGKQTHRDTALRGISPTRAQPGLGPSSYCRPGRGLDKATGDHSELEGSLAVDNWLTQFIIKSWGNTPHMYLINQSLQGTSS